MFSIQVWTSLLLCHYFQIISYVPPSSQLEERGLIIICIAYLKGQTCKVDGRTEGQARSKQSGQQDVTAAIRSSKALVRTIPCTLGTLNTLWLTNDVVPHDLFAKTITLKLEPAGVYLLIACGGVAVSLTVQLSMT